MTHTSSKNKREDPNNFGPHKIFIGDSTGSLVANMKSHLCSFVMFNLSILLILRPPTWYWIFSSLLINHLDVRLRWVLLLWLSSLPTQSQWFYSLKKDLLTKSLFRPRWCTICSWTIEFFEVRKLPLLWGEFLSWLFSSVTASFSSFSQFVQWFVLVSLFFLRLSFLDQAADVDFWLVEFSKPGSLQSAPSFSPEIKIFTWKRLSEGNHLVWV